MSTSGCRAAGGAAGPDEQSQRTAAPILLCSVVGRVALAGSHEALSGPSNSHRVVCRNGTERPNNHSSPPDRIIQLYHYRRGAPIRMERESSSNIQYCLLLRKLEESHGLVSVLSLVGLILMQNRNHPQVALRDGMDAGRTVCDAAHVLVRRTEPDVPTALLVPFWQR